MNDREIVAALERVLEGRIADADVAAMVDRATERGLAEAEEAVARLVRRRALRAALAEMGAEPLTDAPPHPSMDETPAPPGADEPSAPAEVLVAHAVLAGTIEPAADDLEVVERGGLAMIASWSDPDDLDDERWTAAAPDRELIERLVSRHDAIVREACSTGRAVPLRFGGIFRDPDSATRWLAEHEAPLAAALELVGDCWEWTVRVRGDAQTGVLDPLEDLARAHLPEGSGRLDATYLVSSDEEDDFTGAVEALRDAGAELELSGPWPPYTFAEMTAPVEQGLG